VKKLAIVAAALAACSLFDTAAAGPFGIAEPTSQSLVQKTHWLRRGWGGYGGPPYGIEYSRSYGYAFNSGYYLSGNGGCMGVRQMCASRWGWGGWDYRSCLWHHPC
jgi:hypothetical protein